MRVLLLGICISFGLACDGGQSPQFIPIPVTSPPPVVAPGPSAPVPVAVEPPPASPPDEPSDDLIDDECDPGYSLAINADWICCPDGFPYYNPADNYCYPDGFFPEEDGCAPGYSPAVNDDSICCPDGFLYYNHADGYCYPEEDGCGPGWSPPINDPLSCCPDGSPWIYDNFCYGTASPVIQSRIDGDFDGLSGDTIFILENGQIWQQTEYYYQYQWAYRPEVTIFRGTFSFEIVIEDIDRTVRVERLL